MSRRSSTQAETAPRPAGKTPRRVVRDLPAVTLAWLVCAVLLAAPAGPPPSPSPQQTLHVRARTEWMAGFVKLEQAVEAEKAQDPTLALDLCRAALARFVAVRTEFPSWNPSLLDYRINYCTQRIERLERLLASSSQTLNAEQLRKLMAELQEKAGKLAGENLRLKKQLSLTGSSLERARTEAARRAAVGGETEELVRENALLRKRLLARDEELRAASTRLQTLREGAGLGQEQDRLSAQLDLALAAKARLETEQRAVELAYRSQTERLKQAVLEREEYEAQKEALVRAVADKELLLSEKGRRLDKAETHLTELKRELMQTTQELARARNGAEDAAKQQKAVQAELESLRGLRDRFVGATEESRDLHAKAKGLLEKQAELQARNARIEDQNAAFARELEEMQQTVAADREAEAEARASSAQERAGLLLKLQAANARAQAADNEKTQTQAALRTLEGDLAAAKQANTDLAAALAETRKRATEHDKLTHVRTEEAHAELAPPPEQPGRQQSAPSELEAERSKAAQAAELAARLLEAEEGRRQAQSESREQADELSKCRKQLQEARTQVLQARTEADGFRTRIDELAKAAASQRAAETAAEREIHKRCARLAEELEETRTIRLTQDRALASANKRITELSAIAAQIQAKERDMEAISARALKAERALQATHVNVTAFEQAAAVSAAEKRRAEEMLDALQTRNRELVAQNEGLARQQTARADAQEELQVRLLASTERADGAEARCDELSAQLKEQLALLRKQEERLRAVEAEAAALREEAEPPDGGEGTKTLLAKAEVVDGLRASLRQADRALDQTSERLRQALTRLEHSRQQIETSDERMAGKTAEVETLQRALAAERRDRDAGAKLLAEGLATVTEQLERERERCRALEKTIEERDVAVARASAAARPPSAERPQEDPKTLARGFLTQGYAAERSGAVEAATWNYDRALEADPDSAEALKRLGRIFAQRRDDEKAVEYLTRAFRQAPDDVDVLVPLGYALVNQSQADMAVSMLSRAVALRPDDAAAHSSLGVALTSLGWTQAAEVQFRRALALDKEDGQTAFNLAVLLVTHSPARAQEARKWYELSRKLGAEADPGLDRYFGL